jgi:hypothetical protein
MAGKWRRDYIICGGGAVYGDAFIRCFRAMAIWDRPTEPQQPQQNSCERAIGSIRRDCLTMWSWSESGIIAICFALTRPTTIRLGRTCRSARTGRQRALFMPLAALCGRQFSADFTICMCEFYFREAQGYVPAVFLDQPVTPKPSFPLTLGAREFDTWAIEVAANKRKEKPGRGLWHLGGLRVTCHSNQACDAGAQ